MAEGNLLAIIREKQAQIARLQTELAEAQALLEKIVDVGAPTARPRAGRWRRRRSKMLQHSPTAHEAAKILRTAGRPLHAKAIAKIMPRNGHKVTRHTRQLSVALGEQPIGLLPRAAECLRSHRAAAPLFAGHAPPLTPCSSVFLVPLDLSDRNERVINTARELAQLHRARVTPLHVIQQIPDVRGQ